MGRPAGRRLLRPKSAFHLHSIAGTDVLPAPRIPAASLRASRDAILCDATETNETDHELHLNEGREGPLPISRFKKKRSDISFEVDAPFVESGGPNRGGENLRGPCWRTPLDRTASPPARFLP